MNMTPILSICIPTYNRSSFLNEALASILENMEDLNTMEVIISDNNSTDNTQDIVRYYQDELQIRYHKNDSNLGAVNNLFKAVSLASGRYVWLFSDDEVMVNGSINYLLHFLENNNSVDYIYYPRVLVNRDLQNTPIGQQPNSSDEDVLFKSGIELFAYDNGAMPSIMGFFSSTIIKKSLWSGNIDGSPSFLESEWAHLETILKAIPSKECAILGKAGVLCRLGNYRSFSVNSKVWFDDYIKCFQLAITLGYSRTLSMEAIGRVITHFSKSVVIDKANGLREDSIHSALDRLGMSGYKVKNYFWYYLSFFPSKILYVLLSIYKLSKSSNKH
jgi:glycosyltransferase involved in cell wall biosynthesis